MTRKRMVVLAGSMAVVAILAIGGFATVFAAGNPTSSSSDPSGRAQTFLQRLASNLGISTDKLQQGLKDTADQYVDDAAKNGKITPDQADAAKQRIASSNGVGPFMRFFQRRDQADGPSEDGVVAGYCQRAQHDAARSAKPDRVGTDAEADHREQEYDGRSGRLVCCRAGPNAVGRQSRRRNHHLRSGDDDSE